MIKEYRAYHDAKQRCNNENHKRYSDWGGRGIEFRFNSFKEFYSVLGPRPPEHSLDRLDNSGHYEIHNVRWANKSQQQHNKRVSKRNNLRVSGVREVKSKGTISIIWQSYIYNSSKFRQLYCGPDFFEACCARKSAENNYA